MEQLIIVFASRTESMRFSDHLSKFGASSSLINTPREVSVGCGVSVLTDMKYLALIKNLLVNYDRKMSFKGTYRLTKSGIRNICIPV